MKNRIIACVLFCFIICSLFNEPLLADTHIHNWTNWIVNDWEKPTKFMSGTSHRSCRTCDAVEYKTLPKLKTTKNEQKVISVTKKYLNAVGNYNIKKMKSCFASNIKDAVFAKNKGMAAYCRKYNRKYFTYGLRSISVKGKTAKVKIIVEYWDCYDAALDAMKDTVIWLIGNSKSDSETKSYMLKRLKKYTRAYELGTTETTLTLKFKKTKKGWKISSMPTSVKDMMNCGYQSAFKDCFG